MKLFVVVFCCVGAVACDSGGNLSVADGLPPAAIAQAEAKQNKSVFSNLPIENVSDIKKSGDRFVGALGISLGDSITDVMRKYPDVELVTSSEQQSCGFYNPRMKTKNGSLYFRIYDHKVVGINYEGGIDEWSDIHKIMDEFISRLGEPDESYSLDDGKTLSVFYGRRKSSSELGVSVRSNPKNVVPVAHWKYNIDLAYNSSVSNPMNERSSRCESRVSWPFVGNCVRFNNVGSGLLNKGNEIVTTGRVTMKSDSSVYVYISGIKGSDSLLVDGRRYHEKDEIAVPYNQLRRCN